MGMSNKGGSQPLQKPMQINPGGMLGSMQGNMKPLQAGGLMQPGSMVPPPNSISSPGMQMRPVSPAPMPAPTAAQTNPQAVLPQLGNYGSPSAANMLQAGDPRVGQMPQSVGYAPPNAKPVMPTQQATTQPLQLAAALRNRNPFGY